jgi:hypothetical protein
MAKQSVQVKPVGNIKANSADAAQEVEIVDASGRIIKLKTPGVLAHYKLIEALGETARNQMYVAMVVPLLYVSAIDNVPVRVPSSKHELEQLIERLGDGGMASVMQGMMQHFLPPQANAGALPAGMQFPMQAQA